VSFPSTEKDSDTMKLRFIQRALGRPEYQVGKIYDFNGQVEEGYAAKYIDRGWAVEVGGGKKQDAPADAGGDVKDNKTDEGGKDPSEGGDGQADTIDRGTINIPEGWADLPAADLRTLADSVADAPTKNKAEAVAAIEAEIARRAAVQQQ
jgi:hypothetical protein